MRDIARARGLERRSVSSNMLILEESLLAATQNRVNDPLVSSGTFGAELHCGTLREHGVWNGAQFRAICFRAVAALDCPVWHWAAAACSGHARGCSRVLCAGAGFAYLPRAIPFLVRACRLASICQPACLSHFLSLSLSLPSSVQTCVGETNKVLRFTGNTRGGVGFY